MNLMIAFGWVCVMIIAGLIVRAKVKFFQNILMPASVIGGIIGFLLLNTGILKGVDVNLYGEMATHLFTLSFISIGLVGLNIGKSDTKTIVTQIIKGSLGFCAVWTLLWSITPLIGYGVVKILSPLTDMHPIYGSLVPAAFTEGPGQAIVFGNMFESVGWDNAAQVAVSFAAIGFFGHLVWAFL